MCELLNVMDSKIVQVALNGLDNILKAGELHNTKPNPYAVLIEECYGEQNGLCKYQHSINISWFYSTQALIKSNFFSLMKSRKFIKNHFSSSNNTLEVKKKTPVWLHHQITININLVPISQCQWVVINSKVEFCLTDN